MAYVSCNKSKYCFLSVLRQSNPKSYNWFLIIMRSSGMTGWRTSGINICSTKQVFVCLLSLWNPDAKYTK